jgi:hypothetical protein
MKQWSSAGTAIDGRVASPLPSSSSVPDKEIGRLTPLNSSAATDRVGFFPSSLARIGDNAPLDPIWERRLAKLKSFPGDQALGYVRPPSLAVAHIRRLLSAIYRERPELPAPAISPSADGEILVSWRRPGVYFILSFEDKDDFDWISNSGGRSSGTWDARDQALPIPLAGAISSVLGMRAKSYLDPPTRHRLL